MSPEVDQRHRNPSDRLNHGIAIAQGFWTFSANFGITVAMFAAQAWKGVAVEACVGRSTVENIAGQTWWSVLIRGIVAILFGLAALVWPGITILVLIYLFGAFVLVTGVVAVFSALSTAERNDRWALLLLEGIIGILVGIAAFVWPGITGLVLLYLIAFWAIAGGILEIIAAIRLRATIAYEWLLALSGVISLLFGILILFFPAAGALGVIFFIGAYAILYGILLVILAFQVRSRPAPVR